MKILTVINVGYPLHGGAQITHHTFLAQLAEQFGHECVYVDSCAHGRAARGSRPRELAFRDTEELKQLLLRERPDVVIGALDVQHRLMPLTERFRVPTIAYLNSFEYCPPSRAEIRTWRLDSERVYPSRAERRLVLERADAILTNSDFLRRRLRRQQRVSAVTVYPPFDAASFGVARNNRGDAIAGVCGYPHKGADIFCALAEAFPDERFLMVGPLHHAYRARIQALRNVEHVPFSPPATYLRRAKLIIVPSQWPEPFGRVAVEAMANGIPTLVSRSGGLVEIAGRSGLSVARFRSARAWIRAVGDVLASRDALRRLGERGERRARRFLTAASLRAFEKVVRRVARLRRPRFAGPPVVAIHGATADRTAYARINAQWERALAVRGAWKLADAQANAAVAASADCRVFHDYRAEFTRLAVADEGFAVAVRTWDFGPFPSAWARKIAAEFDQLWVYSRWTRQQAIAAGVPSRMIKVVAPGFDPAVFSPRGPRLELATDKRFRFLCVGEPVARKGIDVLLAAYRLAFQRDDDVCLVIKTHGDETFYDGIRQTDSVARAAADRDGPEVLRISGHLSENEVAALYRSCSVGVFPYRAEGFCLPILEAMACGVPCIVPRFGACLDFCDQRNAYFVSARRIRAPVGRDFAINTLGASETVDAVDFCEIEPADLARRMRAVAGAADSDRSAKGRAAATAVRESFTWGHSAARAEANLRELVARGTPKRLQRAREEARRRRRVFEAARSLFLEGQ